MHSIKDFEGFYCAGKANKQWLKTKKVTKKLAHKQLRRREIGDTFTKYIFRGKPVEF